MHSSFDITQRVGALLQYHGMVIATIFGDKHNLNLLQDVFFTIAFILHTTCISLQMKQHHHHAG
jgi:hypothetical protein